MLISLYKLICVSIIILPRSTVTDIPVIKPDFSSQQPLRLIAEGWVGLGWVGLGWVGLGLSLYSSHFETRPAGQFTLFKPVYNRFVRGVSHSVVTLCFSLFINS
nr:hypothetical protein PB20LOC_03218 [Pectobacterium parmentieri]